MIISKNTQNHLEIKTKKATIDFNGEVKINDIELDGEGEYEVGEVSIEGLDDNCYVFQIEDLSVGSLDFKEKIPKDQIERLSNTDVLIVRVDGKAPEAVEQVNQIEPSVVIYLGDDASAKAIADTGVNTEKIENIKLSKSDIPTEGKAYFIEVGNANSIS
jgi:hypothetical protein